MSSKLYTEERLAMLINIANQYIDEPDIRNGIVSRCHQEIGNLITGARPKLAIDMNQRESTALKTAIARWQNQKRVPKRRISHAESIPAESK